MGVVAIVFAFVTVIVIANLIADHKEKKMKIEAALRAEELNHGYAPGTYSRSFSSKSAYRAMKKENKRWERDFKKSGKTYSESFGETGESERDILERGIKDLEERMKNLDTILNEKKRKADK